MESGSGVGESVTQWLEAWRDGDSQAAERVAALVYQDLRRLAAWQLRGESAANTLQPTALVHEAYLKILKSGQVGFAGKSHFVAVAAQAMRRILVDHARAKRALKRSAEEGPRASRQVGPGVDVLALNEALDGLTVRYPRAAKVVELHFFGGLQFTEVAEVTGVGVSTVERDWRLARAWLQDQLGVSD